MEIVTVETNKLELHLGDMVEVLVHNGSRTHVYMTLVQYTSAVAGENSLYVLARLDGVGVIHTEVAGISIPLVGASLERLAGEIIDAQDIKGYEVYNGKDYYLKLVSRD